MKKNLFLTFFSLLLFGCLCAQSVSPSALVPQGAVSEIDDLSLEWTLGEVFIHTIEHEDGIITQGSEQPILLITPLESRDVENSFFNDISIQVYPNPVEAIVKIDLSSEETKTLDISLLDVSGKKIFQMNGNTDSHPLEMDLSTQAAGMYILRFADPVNGEVKVFKIVKSRRSMK